MEIERFKNLTQNHKPSTRPDQGAGSKFLEFRACSQQAYQAPYCWSRFRFCTRSRRYSFPPGFNNYRRIFFFLSSLSMQACPFMVKPRLGYVGSWIPGRGKKSNPCTSFRHPIVWSVAWNLSYSVWMIPSLKSRLWLDTVNMIVKRAEYCICWLTEIRICFSKHSFILGINWLWPSLTLLQQPSQFSSAWELVFALRLFAVSPWQISGAVPSVLRGC